MGKITFLRHGEITVGNSRLSDINMLQDTLRLSDRGIEQANVYAKSLSEEDFDIIIVADSIRTRQTANIIQSYIKKQIVIEPLLNAWKASKSGTFLSFENYWKAYEQFVSCNGVSKDNVEWENFQELKIRTLKGLKNYEKYNSTLVITHSIIISLFTGITREGIQYCKPKTIESQNLNPKPPDFLSLV